ncbi:MAG: (2Fe-2S)-binding protein [Pyrinomonadaceae bacterium]
MPNVTALNINGKKLAVNVDSQARLLNVLRNDLGLTGTKYGCGEAQCGACTVLIDGDPIRSCVVQVGKVASKQITTIEGLGNAGRMHRLQEAFIKTDAMQCGYCTSGMIMSGVALLNQKPHPTKEEIVHHMNGNICRCGTYQRIVAAIQTAANEKGAAE